MSQIALELPANEDAPARARQAVREAVGDALGPDDRWRAEIIVTELVSNAVVHGAGGPVSLALESGGRALRGQVADPGPGIQRPEVSHGNHLGESGRGLFLVDKLSDGWGRAKGQSRIWFEVAARA
jgi:anti-sigma regulatory factor (Ser/Thr protein kinase)